jgi:hypothetical protein
VASEKAVTSAKNALQVSGVLGLGGQGMSVTELETIYGSEVKVSGFGVGERGVTAI